MNGRDYATRDRAWLERKGYEKLSRELMDHRAALALDKDELITLIYILRLQRKPPKLYIESYAQLAEAIGVERHSLYRYVKALETPTELNGEILRPAYLKLEDIPIGIRYNLDGLYDYLETLLEVCPCEDCVKFRARAVTSPLAKPVPVAARGGPTTDKEVFDFYMQKADERLTNNAQGWR